MSNIETIQKLLNDKANLQAQINISAFDGSIEIKNVNNEKYVYVRKREAGKYKSTYVGKYSEELYRVDIGLYPISRYNRRIDAGYLHFCPINITFKWVMNKTPRKNVQNKKTADVQISGHKKLHIMKCSFALVANDVIIFFTLKCE